MSMSFCEFVDVLRLCEFSVEGSGKDKEGVVASEDRGSDGLRRAATSTADEERCIRAEDSLFSKDNRLSWGESSTS